MKVKTFILLGLIVAITFALLLRFAGSTVNKAQATPAAKATATRKATRAPRKARKAAKRNDCQMLYIRRSTATYNSPAICLLMAR